MASRGRKPAPKAQKEARGTVQPCRESAAVVDFPSCPAIPEPPDYLNDDGRSMWNELAPPLFAQRVLTTADVYALFHLCQLHGEIVDDIRRRVRPTAADRAQLRIYFSEFGMTPSSRGRVRPAGAEGNDNPFKRNGPKARGGPAGSSSD